MVEKAELDSFLRIEAEARKALPLPYVLFLCAVLLCPIWISALLVVFAEHSMAPLSDRFYTVVHWTMGGGLILSVVVTLLAAWRATRRQIEQAKSFGDLSNFQLGWGALRAAEQDWWGAFLAIPTIVFVAAGRDVFELIVGVDRTELTVSGRYWFGLIWIAFISGLAFCFLAFCAWFGYRVRKQRAARQGSPS